MTASATAAATLGLGGFFAAGFGVASTTIATVTSFSGTVAVTTTFTAFSPLVTVAGPVAAALLVIAGVVIGSLDLSTRSQLEPNLLKALENARNTPPVLKTVALDKAQQSILYLTFIETTVFEGPDPVGPATLSSWGGPGWQNLSTGPTLQEIQYKSWDGANWRGRAQRWPVRARPGDHSGRTHGFRHQIRRLEQHSLGGGI